MQKKNEEWFRPCNINKYKDVGKGGVSPWQYKEVKKMQEKKKKCFPWQIKGF